MLTCTIHLQLSPHLTPIAYHSCTVAYTIRHYNQNLFQQSVQEMKHPPSPEAKISGNRCGTSRKVSKRKTTSLPAETVEFLKNWMMSPEHVAHPYPTEHEKAEIMAETGIELKQLTNWFVNNRKRYWKPLVEANLREPNPEAPANCSQGKSTKSPSLDGKDLSMRDIVSHMAVHLLPEPAATVAVVDQSTVCRANSMCSIPSLVVGSPQHLISDQSSWENESGNTSSDDSNAEEGSRQAAEITPDRIRRSASGMSTVSVGDVSIQSVATNNQVSEKKFEEVAPAFNQDSRFDTAVSGQQSRKDFLSLNFTTKILPKRISNEELENSRRKFQRVSVDMWKEACLTAANGYDSALPTLEEATALFGFSPLRELI